MRRRTCVADAGALRPHDHAVWFGDGSAALYALAGEALSEGVRRHEKLMFVADDPDPTRLRTLGDVDRLLSKRQLEVASVDSVYGGGSAFSSSVQLATFELALRHAFADGYTGIRVVADNTVFVQGSEETFERWLAWEQASDDFQSASMVTGICFFDRTSISAERQADLAALHPVRSADSVEPPFSLFVDGDAIFLVGFLAPGSAGQLRRLLATVDFNRRPVLDLTAARLADPDALAVLSAFASHDRPLRVRGNAQLRQVISEADRGSGHLDLVEPSRGTRRCAACGDVIGVYEQTAGDASANYHRGCYIGS